MKTRTVSFHREEAVRSPWEAVIKSKIKRNRAVGESWYMPNAGTLFAPSAKLAEMFSEQLRSARARASSCTHKA